MCIVMEAIMNFETEIIGLGTEWEVRFDACG
jgi:hypothetical protein